MKRKFRESKYGGYTDTTCYFCHQTAEKALKAYLLAKGLEFLPKTHVLPALLSMCAGKDKKFLEFEDGCERLNEYFIETKYPADAPIDYSKEEADKALESASEIIDFVEEKIKSKYNSDLTRL